ncbi:MptD family putative ECF transporter S component [Psychromonas hadalis]|uniref:MptD family putative ECF transporter S component n=1 Tax=Psychromonas hadalis TaxID=211669 RepID=UPI0003B4136B|nr:MptD family putative ECF transporter S component [Psychromonas hadalis]
MSINLSPKDLSTVAIYSVLFFMIMLAVGWLGVIPIFIPLLAVLAPLLGGLPFMIFLTRVDKFGMVSLMGFVNGLLMLVTGMGLWVVLTGIIFGVLADLMLKRVNYQNLKKSAMAYSVFSVWVIGNFLPFYLSRESYFATLAEGNGKEYAESLSLLLPYWLLPILVVSAMLSGFIGASIGSRLLNKQLSRAGVV